MSNLNYNSEIIITVIYLYMSIQVYTNKYTDLKFRKKKNYKEKNIHWYNAIYL
jgi:hypothetical protein